MHDVVDEGMGTKWAKGSHTKSQREEEREKRAVTVREMNTPPGHYILKDGCRVHGGSCTDTPLRRGPHLEVTVDPADRELSSVHAKGAREVA